VVLLLPLLLSSLPFDSLIIVGGLRARVVVTVLPLLTGLDFILSVESVQSFSFSLFIYTIESSPTIEGFPNNLEALVDLALVQAFPTVGLNFTEASLLKSSLAMARV
jgi:hypothetical protein